MPLQDNDPINWTYNGLTTRCTLLHWGPEQSLIRYRTHKPPYTLVETTVPTSDLWEIPLADGSGQQLYKVSGPVEEVRLLADSAADLGLTLKVRTQHYIILATASPSLLTAVLQSMPDLSSQRLPGRIQ